MLKPAHPPLAFLLALCLSLPAPAFALKSTEAREGVGLEELGRALRTAGLEEFRVVMQLSAASSEEYPSHNLMAFTPAGQALLLASSEEPPEADEYGSSYQDTFSIHAWACKVPTKERVEIKGALQKALSDGRVGIRQIVFSPDGKSVYLHKAGRRNSPGPEKILVYNWNTGAATGKEIAFDGNELGVQDMAGSPDGKTVWVLARQHISSADPHSYKWVVMPYDIKTGRPRTDGAAYLDPPLSQVAESSVDSLARNIFGRTPPPSARPNELLIDPSGGRLYLRYVHDRVLAEVRGIEVRAYDLKTLQQIGPIFKVQTEQWVSKDSRSGKTLTISPDGKTLYVGVQENDDPFRDPIFAFDAETGRPLETMRIPGRLSSLAISNDGRLLTATSAFMGGKEKERLVEILSVSQADVHGESAPRLPPDVLLLGPPAAGPKESGLEEDLAQHVNRVSGILNDQRWQELQGAARSLRNLIDRVAWKEGVERNRESLLQLDALVQRVQGLDADRRPRDLQVDRMLRRWEASAVALLSAVSFGAEKPLSEGTASGFLRNPQSLEGHLLYRVGTLWEQSVEAKRPESAGLVGLKNRHPSLPLDFEKEEPRLWIAAIETLLWTTPFDRFEQGPEDLFKMYRIEPVLLMGGLMAQPTDRLPNPSQVLEAFIQVLGQMGQAPLHVRRGFLLREDAAILNLLGVYYETIGAVAARVGQPEAAKALTDRAVSIYEGVGRFVDARYDVWRPPFAAPSVFQQAGTSLGDHVAQINRMIESRRWADLPQGSRQLVELMRQILPGEIESNSEALHQLDSAVQRVQGLTPDRRPQEEEADQALRRWEANAICFLSAASFQLEIYLSESTARNFLANPKSLEGHLWFFLDRFWGVSIRQGQAEQMGLVGIPRVGVAPQEQGQEWALWLDALQVLMWTTPRERFDPTQVDIQQLLEGIPAQTLPSLIAKGDPQGNSPLSAQVQSVFPALVEQAGPIPLEVRLGFLLRRNAPRANLSGAFFRLVSALANRVGNSRAEKFLLRRADERYAAIERTDSSYPVWRPTFNAGMEEGLFEEPSVDQVLSARGRSLVKRLAPYNVRVWQGPVQAGAPGRTVSNEPAAPLVEKPEGMEFTLEIPLGISAIRSLPADLPGQFTLWVHPILKDAVPARWGVKVEVLPEKLEEARTVLREKVRAGDLVLLDKRNYSPSVHRSWKAILAEEARQGLWVPESELSTMDRDEFAITLQILRNSGEVLPAVGPKQEIEGAQYRFIHA